MLRLGARAVLAAVVLEAHGHVSSLIPVRAAVLAAALRDRALLGELPPIVSVSEPSKTESEQGHGRARVAGDV